MDDYSDIRSPTWVQRWWHPLELPCRDRGCSLWHLPRIRLGGQIFPHWPHV